MTQPFHFANGQSAHSAEDLLQLCQQFPQDGVNHLVREDLEKWLSYIGQEDIAQCAASARTAAVDDRQKLAEFLTKCHSLSSPETKKAEESVPETPLVTPPTPEVVATPPVTQPEPEPTPTPEVTSTPEVQPAPVPTPQSQPVTPPREQKPSFFRAIAKLIVNILYRNQG